MSFIAIIALISGLAIGAAGAGAISGGGGGSTATNSSTATTTPVNPDWDNTVNSSTASSYRTSEYYDISSSAFEQINLANGYALLEQNGKNIAGDALDVAVIDTGINLTHNEFSGSKVRSFSDGINRDYINVDTDVTDDEGHGSHVAGIIAADKDSDNMHGVAFNSRIVGYKVLDDFGFGSSANITSGINQAVADSVSIINLSLGGVAASDIRTSIVNAKNNDILTLAATGNDNDNQAIYPARYAADSDLQNYLLAVGSVDSDNNKSSFSNLCGDVANYCLVAPGRGINSPIHTFNSAYDSYNGTSMATPMVSGVAAILRSAWPHLTAADTAQILLQSATDLGASGVDETYGHGLLNAEAAVNNIGQSYIPAGLSINSAGYNLSDSNIVTSSIFGDAFSKNISLKISDAVFFDDFGRDYNANFSDKISTYKQQSILSNLIFNKYKSASMPIMADDSYFSLKFINQDNSKDLNGNITGKNYFNINNFIYDKSVIDPYQSHNQNLSFIYQKSLNQDSNLYIASNYYANDLSELSSNYGLINNDISFGNLASFNNSNKNILALDQKMTRNFKVKTSFSQISDHYNPLNSNIVSDIFQAGLEYKSPFSNLYFDYGKMSEYQDQFLGGNAKGIFSNSNNSKTYFITIKNKKKIIKDLYFISSYSEGLTDLSGNKNGIFRNYSDIRSRGYSMGLFNDNFFGGRLAINYSEPLRVYFGKVDIDIPISRDNDGNISRLTANNISLEPYGQEKNLEISYSLFEKDQNLNLNFLAIEEPMNVKDNKDEYMIFLKYSKFW